MPSAILEYSGSIACIRCLESQLKLFCLAIFSLSNGRKGERRVQGKVGINFWCCPYEIPRNKWIDDFGLWLEVSQIHISMYLLLTPSLYSKEEFH